MENLKHTPGPWRRSGMAGKDKFTCPAIYSGKTDQTVCMLGHPRDGKPFDNAQANACLIAAAPDMLLQLEKELGWIQHIKPQIAAPDSVMLGFEQAIKGLSAIINQAKGIKA